MKNPLDDTEILNEINKKLDEALIDISGNESDIKYFTDIGLWLSGKPEYDRNNNDIKELYKNIGDVDNNFSPGEGNSGPIFELDPIKFEKIDYNIKEDLIEQIEKDTKILDIVNKIYDNIKDIKAGPYIDDGVTYREKKYKKSFFTKNQKQLIEEIIGKYKKVTKVSLLFESTSTTYINRINNTFTKLNTMIPIDKKNNDDKLNLGKLDAGKRKTRRNRKSKKGKKSRKARKSRRKSNRRRGRR